MANQTVNIEEAKKQFADLIAAASEGDEIIITQNGEPLVRLVPIAKPKKKRIAGLNRGSIWTSSDFDEPLPDEFWTGQE
jgi:prevent-host-death family protein